MPVCIAQNLASVSKAPGFYSGQSSRHHQVSLRGGRVFSVGGLQSGFVVRKLIPAPLSGARHSWLHYAQLSCARGLLPSFCVADSYGTPPGVVGQLVAAQALYHSVLVGSLSLAYQHISKRPAVRYRRRRMGCGG
jgi:hypothetical protein